MFNIETAHGNIQYGENIIRTIVTKGVEASEGNAMLYNFNKKLPGFVPVFNRKSGKQVSLVTGGANTVRVKYDEEYGLRIRVYVVIKFGASIKQTTENLLDYIYEYVERITKIKPSRVTISVTGVLSKNLVRRDIEVRR